MRSQSPIVAKIPCSLTIANNNTKEPSRSTTPIIIAPTKPHSTQLKTINQKPKSFQMTTGNSFGAGNNNDSHSPQETSTTIVQQNSLTSSSANILPKSSSTSIRNLSSTSVSKTSKLSTNNNNESNNNNINQSSTKLQTLEQRKLELEKLLSEKNWLLQQIHKQEAQILNGNYENVFEIGKLNGNSTGSVGTTSQTAFNNSVLRRKGSSSLKLSKNNWNFNGKSNRFTLSKSEYDLAQEINIKGSPLNLLGIQKLEGPPQTQKTNSFHDSSSLAVSALSLTKSPSFEFNESNSSGMKYSAVRPSQHYGSNSNENLSNNFGISQCDKYYLSPTSQMYTDGNGFIKASQNIKQCLSSSSPIHKIVSLDSTDLQQPQQIHVTTNSIHSMSPGNQPILEHYDAVSLSPSNNTCDQQNAHFWRAMSNNDRSLWCNDSYIELENESINQFQNIKSTSKNIISPSSSVSVSAEDYESIVDNLNTKLFKQQQHSPECATLETRYPVVGGSGSGGTGGAAVLRNSYPPKINEKSCDELSISSVNSETSKKPKNKQWMESSLDGPIIRPNILQTTPIATNGIALFSSMSPTHSPLSKNTSPHYAYYNVSRPAHTTAAVTPSETLTPSPSVGASGKASGMFTVPSIICRPPSTRTLIHYANPQQHGLGSCNKQGFHRERTKLSSQSMSSGSYRKPKTKLGEEASHFSHSTSYLNYDPYHHDFQQQQQNQSQQQQPQPQLSPQLQQRQHQHIQQVYNQNHHHMELPSQHPKQIQLSQISSLSISSLQPIHQKFSQSETSSSLCHLNDDPATIRYATSAANQPSRLYNSSQTLTKYADPLNSLSINTLTHASPSLAAASATSPDIRIESPKNMTVVQQATFLPYKEITKPFEMSDFYKYSIKFRQKDANSLTMSKNQA